MGSAEHFWQQAEVQRFYSAFGIVQGDVFKTEHGLLDTAVVSLHWSEGVREESRFRPLSLNIDVLCCVVTMWASLDVH